MAQGLQPQRIARRRLAAWLAASAGLGACGEATPTAPQLAAELDGPAAVQAVLAACHAPLLGQMNDVALLATIGGAQYRISAALPNRLRTAGPNGAFLLDGDRVWRLDGEPPPPPTPADRAWLLAVRQVVDAAAMAPLHRGNNATRDGATLHLPEVGYTACAVTLRADTALPTRWTFDGDDVEVRDFLRTTTTWMTSSLHHPTLGAVEITFERAGVVWSPDFFAPPAGRDESSAPRIVLPGQGGAEARSPVPTPGKAAALQLVVLPDPGDWAARATAYAPIHAELERQNQKIAGFPMLFDDGDRAILAAPFRRRPDGPAFVPPEGWQLRDWPDQQLLVVYPADGDYEQKRRTGTAALRDALAAQNCRPLGPIVIQPFFHLQDGAPAADKLAAPVVRISVACTPP